MAGKEKFVVRMTTEEREGLERLVSAGKSAARKLLRARILLKADEDGSDGGWTDERIAQALDTSLSTIYRVRREFVERGLETALSRKRPTGRHYRKLDGAAEAQLIALACSPAPEGRTRWTLQLLADKLVELRIVETISDDTVQRTLKKTTSSLG
jgi:transposase